MANATDALVATVTALLPQCSHSDGPCWENVPGMGFVVFDANYKQCLNTFITAPVGEVHVWDDLPRPARGGGLTLNNPLLLSLSSGLQPAATLVPGRYVAGCSRPGQAASSHTVAR